MKKILKNVASFAALTAVAFGTSSAFANNQTAKQDIDFECFAALFAQCAGMGKDQKVSTQDFGEILNCVMENIDQCM